LSCSAPLTSGEIWVATALPFEARALAQTLARDPEVVREETGRGWSIAGRVAGGRVRLLVTGPGRRRVELAIGALERRNERPSLLLCGGVAGALRAELAMGEIVLADVVCAAPARRFETDPRWRDCARRALERTGLGWRQGVCLGVDRVLEAPAAKRGAARLSGAHVVQMEDHVWAERASGWGIPFLSVRAVLDELEHPIPSAALAFPWRGPSATQVAIALWRQPRALGALLKLGAAQRRSEGALARFLTAFLAAANGPRAEADRLPSPP